MLEFYIAANQVLVAELRGLGLTSGVIVIYSHSYYHMAFLILV